MKYTIKVNELNKESNIKAMATVVFGDSFKVGKYRSCGEKRRRVICGNATVSLQQ